MATSTTTSAESKNKKKNRSGKKKSGSREATNKGRLAEEDAAADSATLSEGTADGENLQLDSSHATVA